MTILKKAIFLNIILMMICPVVIVQAQDGNDKHFDLYILMGQSNMAGRGPITEDIANEHNDRVYMFTKDKQWVPAKHPLHFDKPKVAGVGPGLTFGITIAQAYPEVKIGLIPCAVGGTPIEHWVPGAYDQATNTHPYDDAVERITAAMKYGIIKGVIWHQGESNSRPDKAKVYLAQLSELIQRIRTLTGNPNLPFVVGELGRYRQAYANINTQLAKLPDMIPYTAVSTSENLVHKGDTTHFDGPSAQEMGRRMAVQMLKIQASQKK
ncbi:sialate O-acetylesterase [Mucilaginibacter boryungensis]|uniref:Sialate O-acetylesterase n=1 Tax=Mucilaginibacter boryungensis TaxID=768480 RepID=A0ABR9XHF2_9SPHI|nr:sialate O-acetylesterase [Mucilaginibacter boryungensis]MBE9666433.1 sialate O-acetylesterase [Mucilaginibacter boryungensis]